MAEILGKWLIRDFTASQPYYVHILENGELRRFSMRGGMSTFVHKWYRNPDSILLLFNTGNIYTGQIRENNIVGTAKNSLNGSWLFNAERVNSIPVRVTPKEPISMTGRWSIKSNHRDLGDNIFTITDDKKITYNEAKGYQRDSGFHTVQVIGSKMILTLNNHYVIFIGDISGDSINGTAANIMGVSFEFYAKKINDDILNQSNLSNRNTFASIVGKWHVKSTAYDVHDSILEVSEGGDFTYKTLEGSPRGSNHTLKVVNSQMILSLNNNYCIYTGDIDVDEITGTAKNVKGNVFQFEAKRFTDTPQSIVLPIKKHTPTPAWLDLSVEFKISGAKIIRSKEHKYFALEYYYPLSKFPDVPVKQREYRQFIFDFKSGVGDCYNKAAIMFASAIINSDKHKVLNKQLAVCCIIPASSLLKTANRFERFCTQLSSFLNVTNGFKVISINQDTDAAHLGGRERGDITNLKFNKAEIQQKWILLFDDVMTTGRSFAAIADKLTAEGAIEVTGFYLAKTYDSYSMGIPKWD